MKYIYELHGQSSMVFRGMEDSEYLHILK